MPSVNLQIPLLFDISAGGIVYGETIADRDLFDAHLNFNLAGASASALKTEFEKLLYADTTETDASGVLFYSTSTDLSTTLGEKLGSSILGNTSLLTQPSAGVADASNNAAHGGKYMNPGIPLPNYGITSEATLTAAVSTQGYYTAGISDAGGSNFSRLLIRLMATHLMGHPFAQSFLANEDAIITDISDNGTLAVKAQVKDKLLVNDATMNPTNTTVDDEINQAVVTSGTINTTDAIYYALKADGIRNQILQSIYEGLLGSDPARFDLSGTGMYDASSNDISGGTDFDWNNTDSSGCRPRNIPFRTGDTLSFYFRPHVKLEIDASVGGTGTSYGNDDLSGVGQGSSGTSNTSITSMFFQPRHRWISHATSGGVVASSTGTNKLAYADTLTNAYDTYVDAENSTIPGITMMGTDFVASEKGLSACEFDAHVWKITLAL